jgi:carboxyl-terminal processing protease
MKLLSLTTAVCLLALLPAQGQQSSCAKDIEFLLKEFETKAGHLLKLKNVDWSAVRTEFTAAAAVVQTDQEHLQLVMRLVTRLHDGHAGIINSKIKPADESKGRRFTGPRVHLVTSGDQVFVRLAFKDAADAGLASGQEVIKIDGTPVKDWLAGRIPAMEARGSSFSTPQQALYAACHWGLGDWEGTPITFDIKDETGAAKQIKRVRNGGPNQVPIGPIFPPENLKFVGRQSYGKTKEGMGYVHLRDVPGDLPAQLDTMLAALGEMPGLILDMRANGGGGCDHEAVFGRFNNGRGIEGIGVPPHEVVPVKAADLIKKQDTLILRATELLQNGFPKGAVFYMERR